MTITLNKDTIECMGLFQAVTKVPAHDCVLEDGLAIFLVEKGKMGLAIGEGGKNVRVLRERLARRVTIYEYSDEPKTFIRNLLGGISVSNIHIASSTAVLTVSAEDKGKLIGEKGKNIKSLTTLLKRHHGIESIKINTGSTVLTSD